MRMERHSDIRLVSINFNEHTGTGILEYGVRLLKALKAQKSSLRFYGVSFASGNLAGTPNGLYKRVTTEKVENPALSHYLDPGFVVKDALFSTKFHKSKFIVTVHDLDFLIKNKGSLKLLNQYTRPFTLLRRPLALLGGPFIIVVRAISTKSILSTARRFVCVSEKSRDEMINKFHIPMKKCPIVYPIISNEFKPMSRTKHKKIIIGHISSYLPNKNVGALIKAFKMTNSKDLELRLYGQVPPFKIGDDKRIKYKGFVATEKLPEIFNSFDVFVFPSTWEGFGVPVMEAKRCKIPVITYQKGDLTDIVKRNTLQFKDEEDLARILENKGWKDVNIDKAYNDTKKCSPDYVAKQMIKIYKDVLKEK